ncbi:hypothetical protein HRbin30_02280 [bacterium HR30]|nr:hypothetical protein HRbin30_02280 [bacterium HR30]
MRFARLRSGTGFFRGASGRLGHLGACALVCFFVLNTTLGAAAEFCGYVSDGPGGTLTAVDLPEARFRYRIPVVPAWDFAARSCVGSQDEQRLWCGVSRIYRPLDQFDMSPVLGEAEDPLAVVVVDVAAARKSGQLPFRAFELVVATGGQALVASHAEPLAVVYEVAAGTIRHTIPIPGSLASLASSPRGDRVYATYANWENGDSDGSSPWLAAIDLESAQTVAAVELPRAERPELDYPYQIVGVDGLDQVYLARARQARLEVVDGARGQHTASLELGGQPLALLDRADGLAVYVRNERGNECGISLVSLPELEMLATRTTERCVGWLRVSPERDWVVASLGDSLVVWTSDLASELGRTEATAAVYPAAIVRGGCPLAEPCVGDCDANGTVTVDEVIRAVNIVVEILPKERCLAADSSGDWRISVDEVVKAVRNLLHGCSG